MPSVPTAVNQSPKTMAAREGADVYADDDGDCHRFNMSFLGDFPLEKVVGFFLRSCLKVIWKTKLQWPIKQIELKRLLLRFLV